MEWQRQTLYSREQDWVFPSFKMKGKIPRSASILVADYLRPAALKVGVELAEGQRFGFHNLRHALATFLVSKGTDPKTVQRLLRHANVTTTLELYAHSMTEDRLRAQETVMDAMVN